MWRSRMLLTIAMTPAAEPATVSAQTSLSPRACSRKYPTVGTTRSSRSGSRVVTRRFIGVPSSGFPVGSARWGRVLVDRLRGAAEFLQQPGELGDLLVGPLRDERREAVHALTAEPGDRLAAGRGEEEQRGA